MTLANRTISLLGVIIGMVCLLIVPYHEEFLYSLSSCTLSVSDEKYLDCIDLVQALVFDRHSSAWDDLSRNTEPLKNFLGMLKMRYRGTHDINKPKDHNKIAYVIGSGPVGLINALAAFRAGFTVKVIDRRDRTTTDTKNRDIYFDIVSGDLNKNAANYPALHFVESLGFGNFEDTNISFVGDDTLNVFSQYEKKNTIMQISCTVFERVLVSILRGLDVEFIVDTFSTQQYEKKYRDGDVYIIAEGRNSRFKRENGIADSTESRLLLPKGFSLHGRNVTFPLIHKSMIIKFVPNVAYPTKEIKHLRQVSLMPDNEEPVSTMVLRNISIDNCPRVRKVADDGEEITPYSVGSVFYDEYGVTSAFKRFFADHCELQVFFRKDINTDTIDDTQLVGKLAKFLFTENEPYEIASVNRVDIEQVKAESVTGKFRFSKSSKRHRYILVGDASISAHYRLGVGINFGILQSENTLYPFLKSITQNNGETKEALDEYVSSAKKFISQLEEQQTRSIFWESYCNFVIYGDEIWGRINHPHKLDRIEKSFFGEKLEHEFCSFR